VPFRPDDIKVYPNPSDGRFFVNTEGFGQSVTLKIFSTDGRLLMTQIASDAGPEFPVECPELGNGLYIVQLTDGVRSGQTKLLIHK
jgi:uncharacterized caspase-like protein